MYMWKFSYGDNFRVLRDFVFFVKITPRENKPICFSEANGSSVVKMYPHVKCRANFFAKFSPSQNNHVYSICATFQILYFIPFLPLLLLVNITKASCY